jgi:RimJ/RimL family protein N-acetyltransferase
MSNSWQGKKVRLRAVEPSDADIFHEWDKDTDQARLQYMVRFPGSLEAARRGAQEGATRRPEDDNFFFVIENLEGEVVGSILTHATDRRNGHFKYGVGIGSEHQRKGYAAEAIRLLLRYYFEELRYTKALAEVYAFNEPSIRLHENLGFTLEGRLRNMIYTEGRHHDVLVFGMLAEEFDPSSLDT